MLVMPPPAGHPTFARDLAAFARAVGIATVVMVAQGIVMLWGAPVPHIMPSPLMLLLLVIGFLVGSAVLFGALPFAIMVFVARHFKMRSLFFYVAAGLLGAAVIAGMSYLVSAVWAVFFPRGMRLTFWEDYWLRLQWAFLPTLSAALFQWWREKRGPLPIRVDYEFDYEPVLYKSLGGNVRIRPVARFPKPGVKIWVVSDAHSDTKRFHVLSPEGLTIFMVTVVTEQKGEGDLPPWGLLAEAQQFWPTSALPDGLDQSNLIIWHPFMPAGSVSANRYLVERLAEMLLEVLKRWPDREPLDAAAGDPVEVLPFDRSVSMQSLPRR